MNTPRISLMCLVTGIVLWLLCPGLASAGAYSVTVAGEDGSEGCTIGVAHGHVTADGRPIMWKVRDWSGRQGVFYHAPDASYPLSLVYQANLDGGVGAGVNSAGLATGNSAVGSGSNWTVLSDILGSHVDLDEVRAYWASQSQAAGCFPVIDALGNAVMLEGSLSDWRGEYDSMDPDREVQGLHGFVVRANEFHTRTDGTDDENIGGRYASGTYNVLGLIRANNLSVQTLVQGDEGPNAGYEFARYGPGRPLAAISRDTNVATIVVHGVLPGEDPALATMWVMLGQSNYGITLPTWVKVSETPPCLANGDMYDRATSLRAKGQEATTQASVFPLEAHFFDTVLNTLLPRWRANGVVAEEMKRVEHQFAADAYSLLECLDTRQADNQAPQVDFNVSGEGVRFLFTVAANDADGSIAAIAWDFGDGQGSTQHSPAHTYALAQTYLVSCTVTDDDGVSATKYRYSVNPMNLPVSCVKNARTEKGYATLAPAIWEAESGDVIVLSPTTYHESIRCGGKTLTLRSLDPNDPQVVAATILRGRDGIPVVTFGEAASIGSMLDGLTIVGGTVGVSCGPARPAIARCTIGDDNRGAIEFWEGYEPTLVDCHIRGPVVPVKDPRLIAHWRLDETTGMIAHDSAGPNSATVLGPGLWHPQGGKVGGALELSGLANFATAKSVRDPSQGPLSVFAWVKGGAPGQVILSQAGGANWLLAGTGTGALATELKESGRTGTPLASGTIITEGNWHRVGLVWDGSNRILYVDDVEVARDTQTGLAGSTGNLTIGAGSAMTPASFWKGLIDDVRLYDRAVKP